MRRSPLALALALAASPALLLLRTPSSAAPAPQGLADFALALAHDPAPPTDASLALTPRASHPELLAGAPQDVWLYLALRATERDVPRLGMNLALVIDRSGSMASEDKLVHAVAAAEQLVGRLRSDDRLAIVTYDDEVRIAVPSTPACERDAFRSALRSLQTGGATDLHAGLVTGYEEVLAHLDDTRLNRVLLLSDGLANRGVTLPREIRRRAERCRERGVAVSTMGVGLDYDEDLLSGISRHAGGNYYYVGEPEAVGRHLDRELDELSRVVARDPAVELELGPGVELVDVFGHAWTRSGDTISVHLPDAIRAERAKVVVQLRLRGEAGSTRELARTALRYRDAVTNELCRATHGPLSATFTADPERVRLARRLDVLVKVEVVRNALALEAAMDLQKDGDCAGAQELLSARYLSSRTLNDAEYRSEELSRMLEGMRRTLLELERTRGDARASRDLQLSTQLRGLGYLGSD